MEKLTEILIIGAAVVGIIMTLAIIALIIAGATVLFQFAAHIGH